MDRAEIIVFVDVTGSPSLIVAFVRFRDQFVGHEFSSIGLGQSSAYGRPFFIRHDVDIGVPHLYFRLPDSVSENFDHHENQYTTRPITGNRSIHYH
jgi:hypothetical protein